MITCRAEMKCLLLCITLAEYAGAFVETVSLCKLGGKVFAVSKTQSHPIRYHLPCLVLQTIGKLKHGCFLRRGRPPEKNISRARTIVSRRLLYLSSLMEKRYLAM